VVSHNTTQQMIPSGQPCVHAPLFSIVSQHDQ
jgi:hypothetical protein